MNIFIKIQQMNISSVKGPFVWRTQRRRWSDGRTFQSEIHNRKKYLNGERFESGEMVRLELGILIISRI